MQTSAKHFGLAVGP